MNSRIRAIHDMMKEGGVLADIGTDHAFLPILAVQSGKVSRAYACDIAEGPLSSARENIAATGLSDRITTVLSNGFENVPRDASIAVLAGMGFYTAEAILNGAFDRLSDFEEIIVQINNDLPLLRQWISGHHFTITKERTILDRKKYYTAIAFYTGFHESYSDEDILTGVLDVIQDPSCYASYAQYQIQKINQILLRRKKDTDMLEEVRAIYQKRLERFSETLLTLK